MTAGEDPSNISDNAAKGRCIALVIGVNGAPGYNKPPLEYAVNDAKDMAEVLQQSCGFELLEPPLLNEQATSDRVKDAVRKLARKRSDEDFLLLYFGGHGQPMTVEAGERDVYLVTSNFKEVDVEEDMHTHLSMRWLREKLYLPTQAGRVLLILDCCYAGNMGRTAPDPYLEEFRQRINYYFGAPGEASGARSGGLRYALAAAGHNVEASEKDGHGLMTGLLLPVLQGEIGEVIEDHGEISIQGLHRFLERKMPPGKKPSLSGDSAGRDCILAYYPERAAELRAKRIRAAAQDAQLTAYDIDGLIAEIDTLYHAMISFVQEWNESKAVADWEPGWQDRIISRLGQRNHAYLTEIHPQLIAILDRISATLGRPSLTKDLQIDIASARTNNIGVVMMAEKLLQLQSQLLNIARTTKI